MSSPLWQNYEDKIKAKRDINKRKKTGAGTEEKKRRLDSDHVIVQLLTSKVQGKAQKYCRIGPREFIPYKNSDITIDSLKQACLSHFSSKGLMERGMVIDILAGERGPSCTTMAQIPDLKVIHVRFIPCNNHDSDYESGSVQILSSQTHFNRSDNTKISDIHKKRSGHAASLSLSLSRNKTASFTPKSLSISSMLQLGKVTPNQSEVVVIDIFKFNIELLTWPILPVKAEFAVSNRHFGEGGFRRAYRATSNTEEFEGLQWVVKKYLPSTLVCLQDTRQTSEDHSKKIVQTHVLAGNFAEQLRARVTSKCPDEYGATFSYNKVYMGKIESSSEYVTVEEYIEGSFRKYVNNDGSICSNGDEDVLSMKAECLVHFSYEKSDSQLMLLDIQGAGMKLCDPEIASSELLSEDQQYLYCAGNMSLQGIGNFVKNHVCNKFCKAIELSALS